MHALTLALAALPQADVALEALLPSVDPVERRAALAEIAEEEDERYVAPLLDLLALADTREEWFLVLDTLTPRVGRDMRAVDRPWRTLHEERLGAAPLPPPAGRACLSPMAMIRPPACRISQCRRPTALVSSSSERKELEHTISPSRPVWWAKVSTCGRISCSTTCTPAWAACHAASDPAMPPPMMWSVCVMSAM